jgi:TAP-like protein
MTSSTVCPQWPVPAQVRAHPVTAAGAPPILVVGTTRDPATPYEWAQAAAAHLVSGRLLTRIGSGHVAYTRSACVTTAVDRYLIHGDLPAVGATCTD